MEYRCEDLPQHNVMLVPPSDPAYAALFEDIEKTIANPMAGSAPRFSELDPTAPNMLLVNGSETVIASVSWIWKFEGEDGRTMHSSSVITSVVRSVLAPFGLDARHRTLYGYWHVILPGSKRVICGSQMFGDNADVRPPGTDEVWTGGGIGFSGGGSRRDVGALRSVSLAIDGVFFMDGGFAGPDGLHCFERATAEVDAHLAVARVARDGRERGLTADAIFAELEGMTGPDGGPAPPDSPIERNVHKMCMRQLASQIKMMRRGGERAIEQLSLWTETGLPEFRRLQGPG